MILSKKTKKFRKSTIEHVESSVIVQNALKKLSIEPKEFLSIFRLIFREFDKNHTIEQALKVLDPKNILDYDFIKGISKIYNHQLDSSEEIKDFSERTNKRSKKLEPFFRCLKLNNFWALTFIEIKSGNFLFFEVNASKFGWIFGKLNDYKEKKEEKDQAGQRLLYLTESLCGLVNKNVKFFESDDQPKIIKPSNSLNYAVKKLSEE